MRQAEDATTALIFNCTPPLLVLLESTICISHSL